MLGQFNVIIYHTGTNASCSSTDKNQFSKSDFQNKETPHI